MKNLKKTVITIVLLVAFVNLFTVIEKNNLAESNSSPKIGDVAPEINLKSPTGESIALSSLRGKVVLIDFWASWCPPCRRENPNLVHAYNEYKDKDFTKGKGFTIYSVSLDKSKASWIKGIKDDDLAWQYHVSDLNYWNSSVVSLYKINGIPTNYLIDENGKILAKDLRGNALNSYLKTIVK